MPPWSWSTQSNNRSTCSGFSASNRDRRPRGNRSRPSPAAWRGSRSRIFVASCDMPVWPRLQEHIDLHRFVAEEQRAQILVIAQRTAGQQEHVRLVVGDVHRAFQELVGGVGTAAAGPSPAGRARAWPSSEGGSSNFTGTASPSPSRIFSAESTSRPWPRRAGSLASAPSRARSSTRTVCPFMPVALDRAFHREAIAGKDPGRNVELGHADVDGLLFRADADGVDGNVRLAGEFHRRRRAMRRRSGRRR